MKRNFMRNKTVNSVSKLELKNSLIESMHKNTYAIDYIINQLRYTEDILGYNPDDEVAKQNYKDLKYIEFILKYMEDSYRKSAKEIGVII